MSAQNTRDGMRTAFFNHPQRKIASKTISFFGIDVEVRQPSIGAAMSFAEVEDKATQAFTMIMNSVYVPGTDERLFEEADRDEIMASPMDGDFKTLMDTISSFVDVDLKPAAGK